jgi:hypothetical protein
MRKLAPVVIATRILATRILATRILAAGIVSAASLFSAVQAQELAPGPALPGNTGGSGPGSTEISPGAAGGSLIRQQGPGDVPLSLQQTMPSQPPVAHTATPHRLR